MHFNKTASLTSIKNLHFFHLHIIPTLGSSAVEKSSRGRVNRRFSQLFHIIPTLGSCETTISQYPNVGFMWTTGQPSTTSNKILFISKMSPHFFLINFSHSITILYIYKSWWRTRNQLCQLCVIEKQSGTNLSIMNYVLNL